MEKTAVLIVTHGSREESANREFERVVALYRERHPDWEIGHCYLDVVPPFLEEALGKMAEGSSRVIVLPYFLFDAVHVTRDIPAILSKVQSRFPNVKFEMTRALGTHPGLLDAMDERIGGDFQIPRKREPKA